MIDLEGHQRDQREWVKRNFADTWVEGDARDPVLGIAEETGELAHAILKRHQGIRGTAEEHEAAARDALGDIVIYAMDVCNRMGWSLEEIIEETWTGIVKKRDWNEERRAAAESLPRARGG